MRHFLVPFGVKPKPRIENPYADMYVRALAAAFDVLCLFILLYDYFYWLDQRYFPMIGTDFFAQVSQAAQPEVRATLIAQWLTRSVLQLFFFGVLVVSCQSITGTTPGKWLVGLKIVRAKTHASVSTWRFLVRFLAYIPACAPLMLGVIWMGFNKERRGWHDYVAGTVVLNMRPQGWYWNHTKQGVCWLIAKLRASAVKQPVGEPPAEKGHTDGQ